MCTLKHHRRQDFPVPVTHNISHQEVMLKVS